MMSYPLYEKACIDDERLVTDFLDQAVPGQEDKLISVLQSVRETEKKNEQKTKRKKSLKKIKKRCSFLYNMKRKFFENL